MDLVASSWQGNGMWARDAGQRMTPRRVTATTDRASSYLRAATPGRAYFTGGCRVILTS